MPILLVDDLTEIAGKKAEIAKDEIRLAGMKARRDSLYASFTACPCVDMFVRHRSCMRQEEEYVEIGVDVPDLEKQIVAGKEEIRMIERQMSEADTQQSWAAAAVVGSAFLVLMLLALSVPMRMYMDGPARVENKVETAVRSAIGK